MSRNALLATAAVAAALALVAFAVLDGSDAAEGERRDAVESRPEPEAPADLAPAVATDAPSRVESAPAPEVSASAPSEEGDAGPWRLAIRVVTVRPETPLVGWRVMLTEVGATRTTALASEHRVTLDAEGLGVFDDLPRRGPWYVHLADARPDDRGFEFVKDRLGAASASDDPEAEPVRFEVKPGPRVLLFSALPAGVKPEDLLVRLSAEPSMLSSQMGGLGGVVRGRAVHYATAEAIAPRITNGVRGEGVVVDVWTDDGGWWVRKRVDERIENDGSVEISAPLEPAGRFRFRITPEEIEASQTVLGAVTQLLRQGDPIDPRLPGLGRHYVDLGGGSFEVHGLRPGPVWVDEGAEHYGVRLAPLQAQASPTNPAEVAVEVLGLQAGDR